MAKCIIDGREKRIKQLKACGQTIIDRAEDIIGEYDMSIDFRVTIEIPCQAFPVIRAEKTFYSKEAIDAL